MTCKKIRDPGSFVTHLFHTIKQVGKWLYRQWMRFANVLSIITTTVLLTVIYFIVIGPVALVMRLLGNDPLTRRWETDGSYWRAREAAEENISSVRQQF